LMLRQNGPTLPLLCCLGCTRCGLIHVRGHLLLKVRSEVFDCAIKRDLPVFLRDDLVYV
jgi:hypothetical protein